MLAAKGLDCSAKDDKGVPAIAYAASVSTSALSALVACGAKVNARDADGLTAMIRAAQVGRTSTVKLLVAAKATTDNKDKLGYTALMWAAHGGWSETINALLAAKADAKLKSGDGRTAKEIALSREHADAAALLP